MLFVGGEIMEIHWIFFIIGFFIGAAIGVIAMCLCAMAGANEREAQKNVGI